MSQPTRNQEGELSFSTFLGIGGLVLLGLIGISVISFSSTPSDGEPGSTTQLPPDVEPDEDEDEEAEPELPEPPSLEELRPLADAPPLRGTVEYDDVRRSFLHVDRGTGERQRFPLEDIASIERPANGEVAYLISRTGQRIEIKQEALDAMPRSLRYQFNYEAALDPEERFE